MKSALNKIWTPTNNTHSHRLLSCSVNHLTLFKTTSRNLKRSNKLREKATKRIKILKSNLKCKIISLSYKLSWKYSSREELTRVRLERVRMVLRNQMTPLWIWECPNIRQSDSTITSRRCPASQTRWTSRDSHRYQVKKMSNKAWSTKLLTHLLSRTPRSFSSSKTTQPAVRWSSTTRWTKWLPRNRHLLASSSHNGTQTRDTRIPTLSNTRSSQTQATLLMTPSNLRWIWNQSLSQGQSISTSNLWQAVHIQAPKRSNSKLVDLLKIMARTTNSWGMMSSTSWEEEVRMRSRDSSSEMTENCVKLDIDDNR